MSQNYSLLFFLKKPKNYVDGKERFIYMRITVPGCLRKEAPTGRSCKPELWHASTNRAIGKSDEVKLLNKYLGAISKEVSKIHTEFKNEGLEITAETLMNKYNGKEEQPKKLLELFAKHNDAIQLLIDKNLASPNTIKTYKASVNHLTGFLAKEFKATDIELRKIDHGFIMGYDLYLQTEKSIGRISVAKYMKHFKKIVLSAIAHRYISYNPFSLYKNSAKPKKVVKLTMDEVDRIAELTTPIERIERVRDIFLFSTYTGLCYADIKKLYRSEIQKGDDGTLWIFTTREKTESVTNVPLMQVPLAILKKYEKHPVCVSTGLALPVLSNQRMNSYLKEIADLAGITKNLTFHLARHTFGTTITLGNGVPLESVSRLMGHNDIRTTKHYAEVMDEKIGKDMAKLRRKLVRAL